MTVKGCECAFIQEAKELSRPQTYIAWGRDTGTAPPPYIQSRYGVREENERDHRLSIEVSFYALAFVTGADIRRPSTTGTIYLLQCSETSRQLRPPGATPIAGFVCVSEELTFY